MTLKHFNSYKGNLASLKRNPTAPLKLLTC